MIARPGPPSNCFGAHLSPKRGGPHMSTSSDMVSVGPSGSRRPAARMRATSWASCPLALGCNATRASSSWCARTVTCPDAAPSAPSRRTAPLPLHLYRKRGRRAVRRAILRMNLIRRATAAAAHLDSLAGDYPTLNITTQHPIAGRPTSLHGLRSSALTSVTQDRTESELR